MSQKKTVTKSKKADKKRLMPSFKLTRRKIIFLSVAAGVCAILGAGTWYSFYYQSRIAPRMIVSGVAVGGMERGEAFDTLMRKREAFLNRDIHLSYEEKGWDINPSDLGSIVEVQSTLDSIWDTQRSGSVWDQLKFLFSAPFSARYSEVGLVPFSDDGVGVLTEKVLGQIEAAHQETTLSFSPGSVKVIEGKPGKRLDQTAFESALYSVFKNNGGSIELRLTPFQPEVTSEMAEPARALAEKLLKQDLRVTLSTISASVSAVDLSKDLTTVVERDRVGVATGLSIAVKSDSYKALSDTWSKQVNHQAVNARVGHDQGSTVVKIITKDIDGLSLNADKTKERLLDYLNSGSYGAPFQATVETTKADVREDNLSELGIVQMIGTATTDFSGSPNNRKANIAVGQHSLDLKLVKDGETFSTTGTLGPVDESTGYLPELVIKGNRTVPEAGGGLCQVSTTLFRAVLNAGLPIVERQNHAYRVSYYEREVGPGLDATVYIPSPDLKWKNDTGHPVYVQSFIVGTKITFEIYGTSDGRVSTIGKPVILETYPVGDPIYVNTDTLDKGVTKQIEKAHDGAKTSVEYSVNRNGQQIYKKTFISVYKAWPAQYLVGTKEPTATPSPEVTQ